MSTCLKISLGEKALPFKALDMRLKQIYAHVILYVNNL